MAFDKGGSIEFTRDSEGVVRARFIDVPSDWRDEALQEGRQVAEEAGFLAPSLGDRKGSGESKTASQRSSGDWLGRMVKAASIRVWLFSLLGAAIVGALAGKLWPPLAVPAFFVVFVVAWLGFVMNDSAPAVCSWCGKRVKIGSTVCHHCGRPAAARL